MLTINGDAELVWFDASDPLKGVQYTVRPANKTWKAIEKLSGGEKVRRCYPPNIVVLDFT